MSWHSRFGAVLRDSARRYPWLWLSLLALALYLPTGIGTLRVSPDAVEYIDIARRVAAGEGYLLGLKAFHIGGADVLHDGREERAPLYPLIGAALLRLGFGLTSVQAVNALFAAVCVGLLWSITNQLFGARSATLAALLLAFSPAVLFHMVAPMTEALSYALILLAVWLVLRPAGSHVLLLHAAAGLVLGLAYLARPTTLALAGVLILGQLLTGGLQAPARSRLALLCLGLGAIVLPVTLHSLVTRESFSYSGQTYLYSVLKTSEVGRGISDAPLPRPLDFVRANPGAVLRAIGSNLGSYASVLFLDPKWLLFLLPAWPLMLIRLVRRQYPPEALLLLALAATNFLVYALTWSANERRYQLLTLMLLLPFAVDGLQRLVAARPSLTPALRNLAPVAFVVAVGVFWLNTFLLEYRGSFSYYDRLVGSQVYHGLRWTGPASWVEDRALGAVADWVQSETGRFDVVAHPHPWPYALLTERPATRLPERLDGRALREFLDYYRVAIVPLDTDEADQRAYSLVLQTLLDDGARVTPIGSYRVYDLRGLRRR